ncbi:hypothetical protein P7C70_g4879, partial [Phenoliferia sp. Uapishka_3]
MGTDGFPSPTPAAPFPFPLTSLPDSNVPAALKSQGIVSAGVGRSHTILITDAGEAWSAGLNTLGQCGHSNVEHLASFARVGGALLRERVVAASAGITFSLFLTDDGKVYAVGSGEKGQLGNGKTGEHIAASKVFFTEQPDPILVKGALEGKNIVQISCGQQHSVALDDEGFCYAWGFGGLGRLGLGAQYDALVPTVIPNFAGPNLVTRAAKIATGGTNSLFIDAQGMVSLCGKWKTTGDGSAGQPWMTPKLVQDIMGYKFDLITAGGVTIFAHTNEPKEGDFLVGWGQGAIHGELALGAGAVKSATKPQRIESFDNLDVLDMAAGQNTTFWIIKPPMTASASLTVAAVATAVSETPAPPASTGVDLSGFGFDFGAPASVKAHASPVVIIAEEVVKGTSRTDQGQWEELGRYPPVLDGVDYCQICGEVDGPEDSLECEMCEQAYHGACLSPPVVGLPDGEWFCPKCSAEDVPPPMEDNQGVSKKRKAPADKAVAGKKKKASA